MKNQIEILRRAEGYRDASLAAVEAASEGSVAEFDQAVRIATAWANAADAVAMAVLA